MVSRTCEEFGCLPREARRALERDGDLIARVMEARAYARAYELVKSPHTKESDLPPEGADPLVDLAFELFATGGRGRSTE